MNNRRAFGIGWAVVKGMDEIPIDECKGCGLAHGSPNSEYCSEICERQNKVAKMNPRLPKDGALDGVLNVKPNPPTMHAGMPRDPDLLARLKRMHEAKMKAKEQEDFDPETAKYGINNLE